MDHLEEKLKNIVLAGIGAIVHTVEKSRDAIVNFAGSEQGKELAEKGEKAVQGVVDAGTQAFHKVKEALSEVELKERMHKEKERLGSLARQLNELSPEQLEVLETLRVELREKPPEASFGPAEGKDPASEAAIGKPGVTESGFVPPHGEDGKGRAFTPTAPDDEQNVRQLQTNEMNEHLKQNTPPDF